MGDGAVGKPDMQIRSRIQKDIEMFEGSIKEASTIEGTAGKRALKVIELSKMYASDSKSYLDQGDLYTSFSCISYAHGLLDAVKDIYGKERGI